MAEPAPPKPDDTDLKPRRDGASQAGRSAAHLDPAQAPIDARTLEDGLRFLKALAAKLYFYDDDNRCAGEWTGLFKGIGGDGGKISFADVARFLERPDDFAGDSRYDTVRRPHFLLLLTALKLMEKPREAMNALTGRHLDFYYREVLKLTTLPARPDRIVVLIDPAEDMTAVEIPARTLLDAGADGEGRPRRYRTRRAMTARPVKIAKLLSICVRQTRTGFAEIRAAGERDAASTFLEMLRLVYGSPTPGDPMPRFGAEQRDVDAALLNEIITETKHDKYIELYFRMNAQEFKSIACDALKNKSSSNWDVIDRRLTDIYGKLLTERRRAELQVIGKRAGNTKQAVEAMIDRAVGAAESSSVDQLRVMAGTAPDASRDDNKVREAAATLARLWADHEKPQPPVRVDLRSIDKCFDATGIAARESFRTGWAISSPLLSLSEGDREITVTIAFSDSSGQAIGPKDKETPPVAIRLSTATGWLEKSAEGAVTVTADKNLKYLTIVISLKAADPPLTPPSPSLGLTGAVWPVMTADVGSSMVKDGERNRCRQDPQRWTITGVTITVTAGKVSKLTPSHAETEIGPVDPAKPFEPFGPAPAVGSRLWLGHPDLLDKPLTKVEFKLDWLGAPADFATHYAHYFPAAKWDRPKVDGAPVSVAPSPEHPHPLFSVPLKADELLFRREPVTLAGALTVNSAAWAASAESLKNSRRVVAIELSGWDFGHAAYPVLAAQKAGELAKALSGSADERKNADCTVPPPPYTPKLKSLGISFSASRTVELGKPGPATSPERFFHLHPFGAVEWKPGDGAMPLLPAYDNAWELYIGLTGAVPGQSLSLLIQVDEGGAVDPTLPPTQTTWSCLTAEGWRPLAQGVEDGAAGLIRSGVVRLTLPANPGNDGRLPEGRVWLRLAASSGHDAMCPIVAVHPNAVEADFVGDGDRPDLYRAPLPPNSVIGFVDRDVRVKEVRQPFGSFGGRPPEEDSAFRIRVSERLRHKRRAVTPWDYERLVLQEFPEVYKVKCLRADEHRTGRAQPQMRGVRLLVVPDIRGKRPADPYMPKASHSLLEQIGRRIQAFAPPGVTVEAINPVYRQVRTRIAVRFTDAGDTDRKIRRLSDDIRRYLAPWAFDAAADIVIDRRIYANSLVDFVRRRPYVDFVGHVLLQIDDESAKDHGFTTIKGGFAESARPDQILTAAPHHVIDNIVGAYRPENFRGIGYTIVGVDSDVA